MRSPAFFAACVGLAGAAVSLAPIACSEKEPQSSTYFQRTIAPILTTSCVRTNTGAGCHVADTKGNAFGNLDLASFDGVSHRRDLLLDYGPYGQPALLVKNVPPLQIAVSSYDGVKVTVTTDIKHTGGPILDPTASAYQTLRRWIDDGATENNSGPAAPSTYRLPCSTNVPTVAGFDPSTDPTTPDFGAFQSGVMPVIQGSCGAGNCHGNSVNELYLACGSSPAEVRWNYFAASQYLAQTGEESEIVRRPLAPSQGGSFHEGGIVFQTTQDPGYQALLSWAQQHGAPTFAAPDPGFAFFAHKVQPMLVKKGCMMIQCHSAAMFHDYRLRGGSGGSFSFSATQKNYELTIAQLALESDDVNASRLVRKNQYRAEVFAGAHGLAHRGGPLLEDFPKVSLSGALCDSATPAYDYDNGDVDKIPAYCVIREWHKRERAQRNLTAMSGIVYVKRSIPSGPDRAQDFDVYSPGAELHLAKATIDATTGALTLGADTVLTTTASCGLDKATADIRRPAVSWDGKTIAFAARASASDPLAIYTMAADGTGCAKHADIDAGPASANGLLVHNFDPAFSPPDANGATRIVFASTRGNLATGPYDYQGPQRTPADPTKPNANLYVWEPDPANPASHRIRQMTFLLDMEREPAFMQDGRVIFVTEKRAPNFYQLALRRMNLDGGDYHPLYAQRGSIGYVEARDVVELADKNFAAIMSDQGTPHGGGTLAIINRSIGVDFTSTNPADYPIDPTVIDPQSASSPEQNFFLHSLSFADASASGHKGQTTSGVYAHPAPLPNGQVLVSFGAATDAGSFGGDYDVYVYDPETQTKTKLLGDAGTSEVDAVAIYQRASRGVFQAVGDEPNAFTTVHDGQSDAEVTVLDMPVLASLLFQNTPTGRPLESFSSFDVLEDLPPADGVTDFGSGGSNVVSDAFGQVYVRRRLLGTVPMEPDGSAHFVMPGGLPFVLHLPDTASSSGLPRYQREEMQLAPGESQHQSFKQQFFNNLCGNCHGAISGRPIDVAVQPDILTQASDTIARQASPIDLRSDPAQRGAVMGPPSGP